MKRANRKTIESGRGGILGGRLAQVIRRFRVTVVRSDRHFTAPANSPCDRPPSQQGKAEQSRVVTCLRVPGGRSTTLFHETMGRPRSARAHQAVVKATLKLIAQHGIDATSVDAIADASRVSKATIYNHWSTKEELCLEAIGRVCGDLPVFESGNPKADLADLVRHVAHAPENKAQRRIWPRVMSHAMGHLALARALRDRFDQPRRIEVSRIVKVAISRGQLRPDVDIDLALDLLFGPVMHRYFASIPMPVDLPDRVVDAFWKIHSR